jgi:1-acyl-sn-glycerol-3-phosphate acyltransferase
VRHLLLRHTAARRLLTIPALLLLLAISVALAPIAVVLGGLFGLRPGGRNRIARIALFAVVYFATESAGLLAAAWLWVRAGFGTRICSQRCLQSHYRLLAALLRGLYAVGCALFCLHVDPPTALGPDRGDAPVLPPTPGRPLLILSRHAGPGDSFLLVHALLTMLGRGPRIVLRQDLRFDPFIDVVLGRLPHCFVERGPDGGRTTTARIGRIAATMGPADALLLFPEGGNFTPRRRRRVIASLRRRGLAQASVQARRLRNVLPPHPAGVFTAVDAAPHADLVFVAHTGLDHIQSVRQAWQGIPLTRPVEIAWRTIPAERVPFDHDERLQWLEGNWAEIDAWITRCQQA